MFSRNSKLTLLLLLLLILSAACVQARSIKITAATKEISLSPNAEINGSALIAPIELLNFLGAFYHETNKPTVINVTTATGDSGEVRVTKNQNHDFVNLQDLANAIGARAQWNAQTSVCNLMPTVRSVVLEQETLSVKVSFPVSYSIMELPGKLVIDVKNSGMRVSMQKTPPIVPDSQLVAGIRTGEYNKTTARVVLDLKAGIKYSVESPKETGDIVVKLEPDSTKTVPEKPEVKIEKAPAASYTISQAEIWDVDGTSFDLSLSTSAKGKVTTTTDTKRGIISLVLTGARLPESFVNPDLKHPMLRSLKFARISQNPLKVKVDIELNRAMKVQTLCNAGSVVAQIRPFNQSQGKLGEKIIVIDPGHGGSQPGAVSGGVKEMDANLSIARKLAAALRKTGATVILTRESNVTLDLASRPQVATDNSAHFFISIHCNSNLLPNSVSGTETYYHGWNADSIYLAKHVQAAVIDATNMINRGARSDRRDTKSSGFKVLRLLDSTEIPAILVECGYLNHSGDRSKLLDPVFQGKLAAGIVAGLESYIAGEPG